MKVTSETWLCIFGTILAILVRCCTMLHPYSGQGKPPMFGDYEAQRHWMEITYNLPVREWYHNTTRNDLQYWGLDYPPLTAYHSYLCGLIASFINRNYVDLHKSRGYENDGHKLFMRYSVLIVDLLLYFPAVFAYFILTRNVYKDDEVTKSVVTGITMSDKSTMDKPLKDKPLTAEPLTDKPITDKPFTNKPLTNKSLTYKPVTNKPLTNQPLANQPLANKPLTNKSHTNKSHANKPLPNKPPTNKPSTNTPPINKTSTNTAILNTPSINTPPTNKPQSNKPVINKPPTSDYPPPNISISLAIALSLFYPGVILIDHGHFQYNCVSLSFAIFAITFICINKYMLSTFFFCLALNYKQMELYHALPFFMYLLSLCIPKPGQHALSGLARLMKIGLTVIFTFALIWSPFLFTFKDTFQVIHRLFPIARGVFEDKVANIWCTLNIFYKFTSRFCNQDMLRYCTIVTLASVLPSLIDLFLRPNIKKFVPSLINSSLAFFLFSFQVHEKSILLAAVPVMLYLPIDPIPCFWFLFISTFSMLPLLIKDQLVIAFISLLSFYTIIFILSIQHSFKTKSKESVLYILYVDILNTLVQVQRGKKTYSNIYGVITKHFSRNYECVRKVILCMAIISSLLGSMLLSFLILVYDPPKAYPDIFPLMVAVYSCVHFLGFFLYFNYVQIMLPQSFPVPHLKVKTS